MFAPSLLCLGDVRANSFIPYEQPCFVEKKDLERSQPLRVRDFVACPMEYIEKEGFQQLWRIAPTVKIEGLESAESECVVRVVEQKAILPGSCPAMQALFQFSHNLGQIAQGPLFGF